MKNLIVTTYITYLPFAVLLTLIVARIFFKNARIFMMDIFSGREEIATSTNKIFEVGFYLLSLGFALFILKVSANPEFYDKQAFFETLSTKVGTLAVFLGIMVFGNLYMLFRGKRKSSQNRAFRQQMDHQQLPT